MTITTDFEQLYEEKTVVASLSDKDIKKVNALCKQYDVDYNISYRELQEKMKPITKKFEDDVTNVFAP